MYLHTHVCLQVTTIEAETGTLKESKMGYTGGLEGGKGKVSKTKETNIFFLLGCWHFSVKATALQGDLAKWQ